MKHGNVGIFVPHMGCPNQCSFCNQKTITGQCVQPTKEDVLSAIHRAIHVEGDNTKNLQIAFFGGSFTAIDKGYMTMLLSTAYEYVRNNQFSGIRVSTRPDRIDDEILTTLKSYGVNSIELGAQSMDDEVLEKNLRGHTENDVIKASKLIHKYGIELGLQMMTGLYCDTDEKAIVTAKKIISLSPATVRIYPTVVLKGTYLEELLNKGLYIPQTLEQGVNLCAKLIPMFENAGINIIRLGLHSSDEVKENYLGGAYHQAFKELVESKILLDNLIEMLKNYDKGDFSVFVNPKSVSKLIGQNKCNITQINNLGYRLKVRVDDTLSKYELRIENGFKIT